VGRKREKRNVYWILLGKYEGKRELIRPSVDGNIVLKYVLKKETERLRLD
jgi:hypothetical protein